VASAAAAVVWLTGRGRLSRPGMVGLEVSAHPTNAIKALPSLLTVQVLLGVVGVGVLLAGPGMRLIDNPGRLPASVAQAGDVWGWLALSSMLAAATWHARRGLAQLGIPRCCVLALVLGLQIACRAARWDEGNWLSYHVLTTAWLAVGAGTLALGWRRVHPTTAWVTAIGALVLSLVVRGVETDPAGAGWSAI